MLLSRRIWTHPLGGVIRALEESRTVTPASIRSPGTTLPGREIVSAGDFPDVLEEEVLVPDEPVLVPHGCASSSRKRAEACGANAAANSPRTKTASAAAAGRGRLPNMGHGSAG
jgi:hypothetical protein